MSEREPRGLVLSSTSHNAITIDIREGPPSYPGYPGEPAADIFQYVRSTLDGETPLWERDIENGIGLDEIELRALARVLIERFPDVVLEVQNARTIVPVYALEPSCKVCDDARMVTRAAGEVVACPACEQVRTPAPCSGCGKPVMLSEAYFPEWKCETCAGVARGA